MSNVQPASLCEGLEPLLRMQLQVNQLAEQPVEPAADELEEDELEDADYVYTQLRGVRWRPGCL